MVPGPNRDPLSIDQRGQVMGMDVGQRERDRSAVDLGVARPVDGDPWHVLQFLHGVADQGALVRPDGVHPELGQVIDRRSQADAFRHTGCPRLELPGQVVPGRLGELDPLDHVAASQKRRHRLQQRAASPQHADPGWPAHLVAGEGVEVDPEILDVDRHVGHRLGAVHQDESAGSVRRIGDRLDGIDRPQGVRLVRDGEQANAVELSLERVQLQQSVVIDTEELQPRRYLAGQELPGHEVAVVLHLSQQDAITRADVGPAPAEANQVDRLGGIPGEDHFLRRAGVDEPGDPLARSLVGSRRFLADGVDAAVRVRVVAAVVVVHDIDDRGRLLRRRRAVEVDHRFAVDSTAQNREVGPNHFRVERPRLDHAGCPSFIRSATETDSRVAVILPCSCSQKACAEQGVSA